MCKYMAYMAYVFIADTYGIYMVYIQPFIAYRACV